MVAYVGKQLPAYIMLLLLIYEIEIQTFLTAPYGIMEITALFLLTLVHYLLQVLLRELSNGSSGLKALFVITIYQLYLIKQKEQKEFLIQIY